MENIKDKIKDTSKEIRKEARQKTVNYMLAALGLVAGLAWNEAIKAFIEYLFPMSKNTILAKFIYAIAITIVVAFFSIYVTKLLNLNKENKN